MSICVLNVFLRRYSFSAVFLGMVLMAVTEPECEDTAEIVPSATVVNMFGEEGNIVKDWLLLGSFPGSEPRHLHTSDYLKELGGEGSAFIKNNTSVKLQAPVSGKHMLRPKSVSAGQEGLVEFDTEVKTGTPRVVYAYSLLKSHNYEGVRFYLGGGEGVKFYLNGELLRNSWHESEVSERLFSDIFTGDLIDGYNTLLLKFTLTQKRNGFILEVCDTSDRMAPFRERISEFSIETLPQGVEDEARFLKFRPRFPVHIPEGFTEIGINLYEVNSIPGPDKRIISLDKQLSPEIRFKIPGTEAR
ncbi:MAG: hypothetical protein ACOCSE_05470, partial [Chitinivibrionales bacterium]